MTSHSRCCRSCLKFQGDGICAQYHKTPPDGFAARCRHFEAAPYDTQQKILSNIHRPAERLCSLCPRHDMDDFGEWCLVNCSGKQITWRPLYQDSPCPLNITI